MQHIILHLDMNSYFASVEQQANPFLRNKPVGVCAYLPRTQPFASGRMRGLSANGCIIASSIEAKKLGIKTAFRVNQARKICPSIILIENDPNKYRTVASRLFRIMSGYSAAFEPYSIDEAFLDLTGPAKDFSQAATIAAEIRQRIKQELGSWLKCAIGISYTKFLAKFCSDTAAVDQTKIFQNTDSFEELYRAAKLTDAWGIGYRLAKRLNDLGIDSLLALKNRNPQNLIQALGRPGYFLWAKVNGLEIEHFKTGKELLSKSIGHSYCLPKKTTDKKYLSAILFKLVEKIGRRLRAHNQTAHGIYLHWSYEVKYEPFGKSFKLKSPVFSTEEIFQEVNEILQRTELIGRVGMLAVSVFSLSPLVNQLSIFPLKDYGLVRAVDKINSRYGDQSVYRGKLWQTAKFARDRIGFRKLDGLFYQLPD